MLQEAVRKKKVVLSKVRGDINPADVLTKPKSLDDMKQLLGFSCIDWCDRELVNSIGNHFVSDRTWRPRGVGQWMLYPGPDYQFPNHVSNVRHEPMFCRPVDSRRARQTCCANANTFGSSDLIKSRKYYCRLDTCCHCCA